MCEWVYYGPVRHHGFYYVPYVITIATGKLGWISPSGGIIDIITLANG